MIFHEIFVKRFTVTANVALRKPAVQSSDFRRLLAARAVDNDLRTSACTKYRKSSQPWWAVDLGKPMDVGRVCVTNDNNKKKGWFVTAIIRCGIDFVALVVS